MKYLILSVLTLVTTMPMAHAQSGYGGMSECISLSVGAALDAFGEQADLYPIPRFTVTASEGSPSNGIDIRITFANGPTYDVIASPNSRGQKLLGCQSARIGRRVE